MAALISRSLSNVYYYTQIFKMVGGIKVYLRKVENKDGQKVITQFYIRESYLLRQKFFQRLLLL